MIALDLPGFGHSPMPLEPISIPAYARCVEELLERLGIGSAALVGISMGGMIAAELAARRPESATRLALLAPVGVSISQRHGGRMLAGARRIVPLGVWVGARAERLAARPGTRRLCMRMSAAHPELLAAPLAAEQLEGEGKPAWLGALAALIAFPLRARLDLISCPTLVVWGERDRMVPARDAAVFEGAIAGARTVLFADTGHSPQLERPAEFNALLLDFLAQDGV